MRAFELIFYLVMGVSGAVYFVRELIHTLRDEREGHE